MRLLRMVCGVLLAGWLFPQGAPGESASPLRFTSPKDGSVVTGTVTIRAEVAGDLEISFVVFGVDGERPLATNTRPYTCSLDTRALADGVHVLFVEAHGPTGLVATAGPIRVIVRNRPAVAQLPVPRGPLAGRLIPPVGGRRVFESQFSQQSVPIVGQARLAVAGNILVDPVRVFDSEAYVPVRPAVEHLGGMARWDSQTRIVTLWCRTYEIELEPGSVIAKRNGRSVRLWRPPTVDAGRTLLPARCFGSIFDLSVLWDPLSRLVTINPLPDVTPPEPDRLVPGQG